MPPTESTPLLTTSLSGNHGNDESSSPPMMTRRQALYDFLEARTDAGSKYELFMVILILANVLSFILASLFDTQYNPEPWAARDGGICGTWCDTLWFGNYTDNYLQIVGIGSTSVLELVTIVIFTIEYLLRLYTADLEGPKYQGIYGRYLWMLTFYSFVDLASTVPFYIDAFFLPNSTLLATSFLRMFRLFRMARGLGRYDSAISMLGDVFRNQKEILGTALFVGFTTWMTVSSLYYIIERRNKDMIYCGAAPDYCPDDIDTALCEIDSWGFTDCSKADCPGTEEYPEPCYNLFNSIPMSSYYSLLNLFGEFPLIDQHSSNGQVVGTLVAIVAVAVFALPAGIIGNGLEDEIAKRTEVEYSPIIESGGITRGYLADESTTRGRWYNFFHAVSSDGAWYFDLFINILVLLTALTYMLDSLGNIISAQFSITLDAIELVAVTIFTVEYCFRLWCIKEDPKYAGPGGRVKYMYTFMAGVDVMSFLPYWVEIAVTGAVLTPYSDTSSWTSNLVSALRLLRLLRFERYTHAFTTFDDVVSRNFDVLAITLFSALLVWVFFGAWLYFTERDNPDEEMASNYNTVPNSMWVTLLNLSGESPLSQYSAAGKVATGILGLFATAVFGIPIGLLGAGFEEVVAEENPDNVEELERSEQPRSNGAARVGTAFEKSVYDFVNGDGSKVAQYFEMSIYVFILGAVAVGCWQTVEGQENAYSGFETLAVIVFTIEYLMRFIGVGSDPEFATGRNALTCRLHFIISFYSVIDLLAIAPFYLAMALPNSIVDQYDEYLRMLRILRLAKLDKYVPSLTLIDDVIRLKYNQLKVALYAAITLWILFAALMFVFEHGDEENELDDPLPKYGCDGDCTMADRFQNFFDSMFYTGVHLTGDYPIITYDWPARFLNFFMVIAAVGVVSVPSGVVASGFLEIVQSKTKKKQGIGRAGDDWYEERLRALADVDPPPSKFGPTVDRWQFAVDEWLNGKEENGKTTFSTPAMVSRVFIFLVIIANVVAVVVESIPAIDKKVGNQPGNFFDVFEAFSVFVFLAEYLARLFCAPKNREALYSTFIYATTFFGIVDFMSTAPWFVQQFMLATGMLHDNDSAARIFRIFRIFRLLQLEDFITAFSKLDNVFRASMDVLKATGLLALIIWVGCGALFFIFEGNNPNWRECDETIPVHSSDSEAPGCYDFVSTAACNDFYPGLCSQKAFKDMPNSLYYTAVFLGGEWGVVDFTWPGRFVCLFLCVAGIALYSIPIGTLFDSFGAVLGFEGDDDEEEGGESPNGE